MALLFQEQQYYGHHAFDILVRSESRKYTYPDVSYTVRIQELFW